MAQNHSTIASQNFRLHVAFKIMPQQQNI